MSVAPATALQPTAAPPRSTGPEVLYTICSVFSAATIAVGLGWLEEEFKWSGASLRYLWSLENNAGWLPHFSHQIDGHLFRDGGAIPAIWAKADRVDTTLLGLTFSHIGGQILVRADSGLHHLAALKCRRIGLYRSLNRQKVDFSRATSERAILHALASVGLTRADVEIVDLDEPDDRHLAPFATPAQVWAGNDFRRRYTDNHEVRALRDGSVAAIYTDWGRTETLVQTGEFTAIADFDHHPDWTTQVTNSPWTITVDTALVREHPEVVIAYLRALVRAGRWANAHRIAAAEILHRGSFYPTVADTARASARNDFVPSLSPFNLAALELQKNFLRDHGYLQRDFEVRQWANPRFLEEALHSA